MAVTPQTAAGLTSANPLLAAGQVVAETDTGRVKVGNGTSRWASLSYSGYTPAYTFPAVGTVGQVLEVSDDDPPTIVFGADG
jgi:hypothetical protein